MNGTSEGKEKREENNERLTSSVIIGALSMVSLIGLGGDVGLALGLTWKPLDSLADLWGDTLAGKLRVLVHCDKPRTIFVNGTNVTRTTEMTRVRRWYHSRILRVETRRSRSLLYHAFAKLAEYISRSFPRGVQRRSRLAINSKLSQ